jgi:type III restriction enzyme
MPTCPDRQPHLLNTGSVLEILCTGQRPEQDGKILDEALTGTTPAKPVSPEESRLAELALRAVGQEAADLPSSKALSHAEVQQRLVAKVRRWAEEAAPAQMPVQIELPGLGGSGAVHTGADRGANEFAATEIAQVVRNVTERLIELTIDVPQIVILPTREVNYRFQSFVLEGLERINFQPVSQELLLRHLEDNRQARIQWEGSDVREVRPEDYIVRQLIDQDAIDYDEHADLLYALAEQVVSRLREHLGGDEEKLENVLIYWQRQLGEFVWAQMQRNVWVTPTDYVGKVTRGFDLLKPASFTLAAGEEPRDFRAPISDKRLIRQMVFKGFRKCCYPYQKFQSVEGEWRLAQVLEDDPEVLKWMKPAPGQFRIEYLSGRNYEPDFVVETTAACLLVEPKRADQLEQEEVQAKARAALRWCGYANRHAAKICTPCFAPKAQQPCSPGQRPGEWTTPDRSALKGRNPHRRGATPGAPPRAVPGFALSGLFIPAAASQGVALGYRVLRLRRAVPRACSAGLRGNRSYRRSCVYAGAPSRYSRRRIRRCARRPRRPARLVTTLSRKSRSWLTRSSVPW